MENSNQKQPEVYDSPAPSFLERLFNSILFKFGVMLILVLFLLIPMEWINDLIRERRDRERSVSHEIASKWGGPQVISGPIIGIPYTYQYSVNVTDDKGKPKTETYKEKNYIFLAAKKMKVSSDVEPEYLKRGIYQSVVYKAAITVNGDFDEIDLSKVAVDPASLHWDEAKLFFGLSDLKGMTATPKLDWKGTTRDLQMHTEPISLFERTMSADISLAEKSTKGTFSMKLDLRGSRTLSVFPTADETVVTVSGAWNDPSFNGGFLPDTREVAEGKFRAAWQVPSFSRKFPKQWVGLPKDLYMLTGDDGENVGYDQTIPAVAAAKENGSSAQVSTEQDMVQVNFLEAVNNYQKTTRVAKYGALVILLTFTALFFTEILKKKKIHFIQYVLIGCAMVLFYSLLLAIGEHLGFDWSYLLSAVATIGLITSFIFGITKDRKICMAFSGVLALFYAFVYFLMQLQDYALIVGSVGVFVILAVLMRVSTRINWYQFDRKS